MFYNPTNIEQLKYSLAEMDNNTYIIAGGTDLIIKLKENKIVDYSILNISNVSELKFIEEDEFYLKIGAITTMSDICESTIIKEKYRAIYDSAKNLGSEHIRNTATIGGNIANASQSADCLLSLFSLDAKVKILTQFGEEKIFPIVDFIVGKEKTILEKKQVIIEILIPNQCKKSYFRKIGSRKAVTISKLSCSLALKLDNSRMISVKVFFGAVGIKPVRALRIERYLENRKIKEINILEIQKIAFEEIENAIPNRKSKYYKRIAVEGLIEDLIGDLYE